MDDVAISFEKDLSLAKLETKLGSQEMAIGLLTALGHTAAHSIGVYKAADPPLKKLKLLAAAAGQQPPSGTKLAEGKVWITNQEQHVMAYRP
jgi:hypothetical protein